MKKNLFGKTVKEDVIEYTSEKMNPFDTIELITRYNYLSTTDVETFYYVMKPVKKRFYTDTIHLSLDEAKKKCTIGQKIIEKKMDMNVVYMVVKAMTFHPELVVYANAADALLANIGCMPILLMLEQEIPKKKYYIKYIGDKKKNPELFKLISTTLEIDSKNVEDCLLLAEMQGKTKEFLSHFDVGGRV
jgi:hypothetical protein